MTQMFMMPRHSGKTAHLIERALKAGGSILVTRQLTADHIRKVARIMGVKPPPIYIYTPKQKTHSTPYFVYLIVDI